MSKVTIRVKEISTGDIEHTYIHNSRLYAERGYPIPENINVGQSGWNKSCVIKDGCEAEIPLNEAIDYRITKSGVKVRKNSVMALEYIVSVSPDFFQVYSTSGYFLNSLDFLSKKHGFDNIVSLSEHYDETNPHAHIVVVPIIKKEVGWKRKKGDGYIEGKTEENRLCARDFTGNRNLLSKLQDDYFTFCVPYGQKHHVTFERGTSVEEQTKKYLGKTHHEMGLINKELEKNDLLMQQVNHQFNLGMTSIEAQKKLNGMNEQNQKLQALKEEKNKGLNSFLQQQAVKEIEAKQIKEWREANKKKGNAFGEET